MTSIWKVDVGLLILSFGSISRCQSAVIGHLCTFRVVLGYLKKEKRENMVSVLVWGTLYSRQWSEKEQDYFYPTLKAMAAVSKVNNYGDSMLLCSTPKHTQSHSAAFVSTHAKTH